jgi:4'-phosphopantetheinyl transferase
VPLEATNSPLNSRVAILSPEERQRADLFRLDAPRQRFVIARAALRILLGRYLGVSPSKVLITVDANNKPRLVDEQNAPNLRFNVAHSDRLALVAVTYGCEIGIDVERLRIVRYAEHIARRYFHAAEIEAIVAAAPAARDAAFMRCWTGKEAVLKAIGTGITGALADFQVPIDDDAEEGTWIDAPVLSHRKIARCWMRQLDVGDDYAGAVAVVGTQLKVRCMAFTP